MKRPTRDAVPMVRNLTPAQAEEHAKKATQDYINAYKLQDGSQIGDALVKPLSVTGMVLAQAVGSEEAAYRIASTAIFIRVNMPARPAKLETVQ